MNYLVPGINGLLTLAENSFNVAGYLPKDQYPEANAWAVKWRQRLGLLQAISGIALIIIAFAIDRQPASKKFLTFSEKMSSLGVLYLNHGIFNGIRSFIEDSGYGYLALPYDFYG